VIFKPVAKINDDTPLGDTLLKLAEHQICVYAAHTNLDIAHGGTNDTLAERLGLLAVVPMLPAEGAVLSEGAPAIGRRGVLPRTLPLAAFAELVKEKIGLDAVRFVGGADQPVKTVGLSTGAGSSEQNFREAIAAGCDVFITGDIRFHEAQAALSLGLALIDATHYASENLIVDQICGYVRQALHATGADHAVAVAPSAVNGQVFKHR
jgi:dinuclear metal center YbgI/SA1388 family protein